jgi:hypothetical protein
MRSRPGATNTRRLVKFLPHRCATLDDLNCAALLGWLAIAMPALAQSHPTHTRTGTSDSAWNILGNWNPFGIPPTNAIVVINTGSADATGVGGAQV